MSMESQSRRIEGGVPVPTAAWPGRAEAGWPHDPAPGPGAGLEVTEHQMPVELWDLVFGSAARAG